MNGQQIFWKFLRNNWQRRNVQSRTNSKAYPVTNTLISGKSCVFMEMEKINSNPLILPGAWSIPIGGWTSISFQLDMSFLPLQEFSIGIEREKYQQKMCWQLHPVCSWPTKKIPLSLDEGYKLHWFRSYYLKDILF